jgi:hypothetical protein
MARRTEEHKESRKPSQPKARPSSEENKKRKPRGPLFYSGDPTLAGRLEDEVYRSGR